VLPADIAAFIERVRDHPAGRYALEQFAGHRREQAAPAL
jgi:hypothetical protein